MLNSDKDTTIPDIFIISLSTCIPCIKTKHLFDSYGIDYECVDVDTASQGKWEKALDLLDVFMSGKGLSRIYPIIIVKGHKMIQGYNEKELNALAREVVIEKE